MNIKRIIQEEINNFDWIRGVDTIYRGISYDFDPGLSLREYKKLLKIIEAADKNITFWDGSSLTSKKFKFSDRMMFKYRKGIKRITINEKGILHMSWDPKPHLIKLGTGNWAMITDWVTVELDEDDDEDMEIIRNLELPTEDGRKAFNL